MNAPVRHTPGAGPDLFAFEPTVRTFPVIEVDGCRAIVEHGTWCCFYAVDAGQPFPSETGFRSAGMHRESAVGAIFAAVIAEARKERSGKLPVPATVYRQPYAGEDKPQPAAGALLAYDQLLAAPLNADLILRAYGAERGDAHGRGDAGKLVAVTESILGEGFRAESDAAGDGFAIIAPSGLRLPARGFFPALHNLRAYVARITRDATRKTAPALFPARPPARAAAPVPLFAAE
jgi:hypothetical protein